ncbi:MAG: thrombospondin N-terminal-like domain protein, partial [Pedosphaera sp.]|nr:thrombospondin N-terminal-like domain protein [Pedosphaera sp.]
MNDLKKLKAKNCVNNTMSSLAFFALLILLPFPALSQPCSPAPSGLVSWWAAEANANDLMGVNLGTLSNAPTFVAGEVGQAFRFNGTNQFMKLSNSPSLNPAGSFSIEAWINYSANTTNNGTIMGKWGDAGDLADNRSYLFRVLPGAALIFGIADPAHQGDISFHTFTTTNGAVPINAWAHVAAVYDQSTGTRRIYVNGVNVISRTDAPITVLNATAPAGIGAFMRTTTLPVDFFPGSLDEVSFYNRALTGAEIASIYGAGSAGKCHPASVPVIVTQPASQSVLAGTNVTFAVVAMGAPPLNYQWQFGLANLAGATNSSLTLSNVQTSQAGVYSVVVYNALGTATSSNATLTVTPVNSCMPPPSGLVSWWPAQTNANDVVGGNSGTLINGPAFAAGEVGYAFRFNATNQFVKLSNSPSLNPSGSFSIEAWINYSGANPSWNVIMGKWGGSGDYNNMRSYIFDVSASRSLAFGIADQAHQLDTAFQTFLTPSNVVPLNVWTHVAAVYDQSTGTRNIYVNGVIAASTNNAPLTVLNTTANGGIGGVLDNSTTPLYLFGGLLDEVSFYNRALTGAEIAAIYGAGSAGKCQSSIAASIVTQPAGQTVLAGTNVTFSVVAVGSAPLGYQWRLNGTNLIGATSSSLALTNVQPASAGNYSVVVSNSVNSVTSANALLTVTSANHPPVANNQTASVPVNTLVAIFLSGSDPDGDPITYTVVTQPTHGTLSGTAPNLLYQPAANYTGPDVFTFKVNDGHVDSTLATVGINVQSASNNLSSLINVD